MIWSVGMLHGTLASKPVKVLVLVMQIARTCLLTTYISIHNSYPQTAAFTTGRTERNVPKKQNDPKLLRLQVREPAPLLVLGEHLLSALIEPALLAPNVHLLSVRVDSGGAARAVCGGDVFIAEIVVRLFRTHVVDLDVCGIDVDGGAVDGAAGEVVGRHGFSKRFLVDSARSVRQSLFLCILVVTSDYVCLVF